MVVWIGTAADVKGVRPHSELSYPGGTLTTCSTWSCRWSAAAAAHRRPDGATPARGAPGPGPTNRTSSLRGSTPACPSSPSAATPARAGRPSSRSRNTAAATSSRPLAHALAARHSPAADVGHARQPADRRARPDPRVGRPPPRWRPRHPDRALAATPGHPGSPVVRALRTRAMVRDSVGLTSAARERNIAGRVRLRPHRCAARSCWSTTSSPPARPPRIGAGPAHCWGANVTAVLTLAHA